MSSTPPRDSSPPRQAGPQGEGGPVTPQRGSPVREPVGTPVTYGPPGFPPDPWVRGGGNPSVDPNSGLSFQGEVGGRVPLGVLHGSGAGLAGNPGWAGNPFTMQAPEGAGSRVPQPEGAQGAQVVRGRFSGC